MSENVKKRFNVFKIPHAALVLLASVLLTACVFILFIVFKPLYEVIKDGRVSMRAGVVAQIISFLSIVGVVIYLIVCRRKKTLTVKKVIAAIVLIGLFIRICYMLVTAPSVRQYDTYVKENNGHEGYAYYIFENGTLPDNNGYQFYHPPLNALIQALFMNVTNGVTKLIAGVFNIEEYFLTSFNEAKPEWISASRYYLYGTCQVLSVVYSFVTMIVGLKILLLVGLKGKSLIFWFAFFALFPRHIVFAATLNNDPLAYLNSLIALYFALKWWLNGKKLSYILLCALFIGLGVCSKLSAATICLPIGGIFLFELIRTILKYNESLSVKNLLLQYGLFLLVCVPICSSFIIYAKVRFDQPLGYVFGNLNSRLLTNHHGFFERFIIAFDKNEYFYSLFLRNFTNTTTGVYNNYNFWNYILRSAIFGEFGYWQGESFAFAALLANVVLAALSVIVATVTIVCYFKERKRLKMPANILTATQDEKRFMFGLCLFVTQLLSLIYFYIRMPYSCTMDFRYVMPIIIGMPLMFSGFDKYAATNKKLKTLNLVLKIDTLIFIASSTLFYMICI